MTPPTSPRQVMGHPCFGFLKQHLIGVTGLAYYRDKDEDLALHIARRINLLGLADCVAYSNRLFDHVAGEVELEALTADLTIGETFFFRHQELFDALADRVIPELIQRNCHQQRLRIWSAGCAIGAEPYSLAILLARQFGSQLAGWNVTILGTDINRQYLAHAGRGVFGDWALRAVPDEIKASCFSRSGEAWVINPEFRRWVSFQYHNLVQHPFPSAVNNLSAFDLILCRNVMIYFSADVIGRLITQFNESLTGGGWFVVGHSEPNLESFRAFETVNAPGAVLYRTAPSPPGAASLATANVNSAVVPPRPRMTIAAVKPPQPCTAFPQRPQRQVERIPVRVQRPEPAPAAHASIRSLLDQGKLEEAAARCEASLKVERLDARLHFYYALASEQMGGHAQAEQSLKRAIYLDRSFVLAHYYLGLVAQRNRDDRAAARSFQNVVDLLAARDDQECLPDADGLAVGPLRQLTEKHLAVLKDSR